MQLRRAIPGAWRRAGGDFHDYSEGECYVRRVAGSFRTLVAGDAVIFPQGDAHRMASAPGVPAANRRQTGRRVDVYRVSWPTAAAAQ